MLPQKKTIIMAAVGILYYLCGMVIGEQDYDTFGRVIELAAILMLALKGNRVENKVEIVSSKVTEVGDKLL